MTLNASLEASPVSNLQLEYKHQLGLYASQPAITRQFLDGQAQLIAHSIQRNANCVRFLLPDLVLPAGEMQTRPVPSVQRNQAAGRQILPGTHDLAATLLYKFIQLEQSAEPGVSTSASLLRYSTAYTMVHQMLPDGRPVRYSTEPGDEIPSQPVETINPHPVSADRLDAAQTPFTPYALRFFLPQWVAFDEKDRLLTTNLQGAEAYLRSMQAYLSLLGQAASLDPYIVADETYQRKRTGMLGQLVNQGRALGRYEARDMVRRIQQRVSQGSLNRGLSLDISYFDDQRLTIASFNMQVIPFGRVMFLPAFVVLASRKEASLIARDPRLNSSTRRHLLSLMAIFEQAFLTKKEENNL